GSIPSEEGAEKKIFRQVILDFMTHKYDCAFVFVESLVSPHVQGKQLHESFMNETQVRCGSLGRRRTPMAPDLLAYSYCHCGGYIMGRICTLHDLNTAFDALLNKVNLTESQAIILYLKALSPDIRGMVKMFRPRTLHEAYGLAKTQALNNESLEEKINKGKGNSRNTRNYSNFNITPLVNASKLPLLPTPKPAKATFTKPNGGPHRLTSKELEYKRAKGECFGCKSKPSLCYRDGR
nr:hypothetical protein [Tanacetum cinerariifolium]